MEKMDLALRTYFVTDELEVLFKYIPSSQLLKFRQVSKRWDEGAKIVLPKRRDIKLILTTDNFDSRTNWDFLKFLIDSSENVFVAPVMHIKNTNEPNQNLKQGRICVTFQIIREICERLGNRGIIQKLIIEDGNEAPYFTLDFVLALLSQLSYLETLEISPLKLSTGPTLPTSELNSKFQLPHLKKIDFGYLYNSDIKEAANLLKIILESSPNLERIHDASDLHDLDLISMLRDTCRLSKMKEITLTKPADLDILLQCKPKIVLRSFNINIKTKDFRRIRSEEIVDSKKLFMFLQQQAVNLKIFQWVGNGLVSKSILTLPLLPKLEKLSFETWSCGCLLSVNYGRHTPALKSLRISSEGTFQSWEKFISYETSSERPPCPALEELNLFINGRTFQRMFENWKHLFPNLKKLTIYNPEYFYLDQVSKCWPNLEELKLKISTGYQSDDYEYKDVDEIVFGIKSDWKRKIDMKEEEWWMNVPAPEISATVSSLKNLQKLEVSVQGCYGGAYLTDAAVYFGLRRMQNLKEISITVTFCTEDGPEMEDVSTEAFNFLVKNLPKLEKLSLVEQNWQREEIIK